MPNGTGNFRNFQISGKKDNLRRLSTIFETNFQKRSVPFDFVPEFPEILVKWIALHMLFTCEEMEPNPFTKQGKAFSCEVRDIILEKWLEGSKPFQIVLQLNLPRKTVSSIVDRFVRTGSVQPGVGGNKIRTARTDVIK